MGLHAERDGEGSRLVLVHGFTQTRRCWGPFADALAGTHQLLRVDAPRHGRSAGIGGDLWAGARRAGRTGGAAAYLGYSMGARLCLHLALADPDLVRGLVLIGGTAGIEDDGDRAERRASDLRLADTVEELGVNGFLDRWLAQPLFAGVPEDRQFRSERRENTVEGLASSLREAGTGSQDPLWVRLRELEMPVLVLAGALDDKYVALGRRIAHDTGDNATFETVDGSGHAAHLEQPERTARLVATWLADQRL